MADLPFVRLFLHGLAEGGVAKHNLQPQRPALFIKGERLRFANIALALRLIEIAARSRSQGIPLGFTNGELDIEARGLYVPSPRMELHQCLGARIAHSTALRHKI